MTIARQPAGRPSGGQFAEQERPGDTIVLAPLSADDLAEIDVTVNAFMSDHARAADLFGTHLATMSYDERFTLERDQYRQIAIDLMREATGDTSPGSGAFYETLIEQELYVAEDDLTEETAYEDAVTESIARALQARRQLDEWGQFRGDVRPVIGRVCPGSEMLAQVFYSSGDRVSDFARAGDVFTGMWHCFRCGTTNVPVTKPLRGGTSWRLGMHMAEARA